MSSIDTVKHMMLASLIGPCTGTMREDVGTPQGLVRQYLVHQFAPVAVTQHLRSGDMDSLAPRSTGVISFDTVKDVLKDVFNEELKRYLVCMLCGTSLRTADAILASAALQLISTPFGPGKLLALLHLEELQGPAKPELLLLSPNRWYMQGFLVGRRTTRSVRIIGKTGIPSSAFWDAIETSLTKGSSSKR